MSRPPTIRDEDILSAARAVFVALGAGATTAEVARRAGVSEGSIFNRFRSKNELFAAAMRGDGPLWTDSLPTRVGKGDLRTQLYEVGLAGIEFFRPVVPLHMMFWSNPAAHPDVHAEAGRKHPAMRGIRSVTRYFADEMRLGRLRTSDPEVLARVFGGSLYNFVSMEVMFGSQRLLPMPADEFVRGLVELLWVGTEPATEPARRKKRR